nr:immunoglobulin heavy chain junction region [Mus musculus]NSM03781.1 immunoglobulin heavy chain junction region [Mus musculus]NSM03944.1 immunoglobulin heavy chain junction region [Mus musculus]NSM05719.1 immunoglobulin heavy chain junction region [Mus musculus]NSM06255.1 immunoglobulin heavy chain junction region [Mus musculus]
CARGRYGNYGTYW